MLSINVIAPCIPKVVNGAILDQTVRAVNGIVILVTNSHIGTNLEQCLRNGAFRHFFWNTRLQNILQHTVMFILALNIVMMPTASTFFFIGLSAVYLHNIYIMGFFGLCWLVILGLFIFNSAWGIMRCSNIIQLTQCFTVHHVDVWGYITTAAYDTLMYLFILWTVCSSAVVDRWQDWLSWVTMGNGLGWLSKVLLKSGQMYYLWVPISSFCHIGISLIVIFVV